MDNVAYANGIIVWTNWKQAHDNAQALQRKLKDVTLAMDDETLDKFNATIAETLAMDADTLERG